MRYYLVIIYQCFINNYDPYSKSQLVDRNVTALCNLIKKLIANLVKLQKLQILYHNKNVKEQSYQSKNVITWSSE